jgi:hypothetical protein
MAEQPEEFLEHSDWMGIPIQGYPVTLDRLKSLLLAQARILTGSQLGFLEFLQLLSCGTG